MQNKSIIHNLTIKNILLLGTICSGIMYTNNANAGDTETVKYNQNGIIATYKYTKAANSSFELVSISVSDDYYNQQTTNDMVLDFNQIFHDKQPTGDWWIMNNKNSWNIIMNNFVDGTDALKSNYTNITYDYDAKTLTLSDKLVSKSTLDSALESAGISDMSIYAKTADVADTYATKTALSEGLGGKVDTSAFNEYKTTVSDTYATKASLNDYVTNDSLGTTLGSYVTSDSLNTTLGGYVTTSSLNTTLGGYATTGSVYTKDQANETFATKGSSYTKSESDAKYLTEHQDISGKANVSDVYTKTEADEKFLTSADMSGYATTDSVYTKTAADEKFATKGTSYTKDEADSKFLTSADMSGYAKSDDIAQTYATKNDLNGYVTSSALDTTLSGYVTSNSLDSTLSDYAKTSDLNAYVTSTALETTLGDYAKSDEVYSKTEMNTKLQDYVTSDSLNTTLSDYVTSDSLTSTLGDYATKDSVYTKTEIDNIFVKSDDLNNTLADYVTSSSLDTKLQDYATATELSGLSDTVSGLSSDVNALQTSVNNKADKADLTALQTTVDGKVNQSDFNDYKTSNDKAVANALSQIANKQDALTSEQMAVLNSGITAADVQTVKDVTDTINTMSQTFADLSTDFGDVADFKNSTTGNIKNDDPSSTTLNAQTVTKAIANIDASIGQVHGLADKLKKAGKYKGNLAEGTTVEEHLAVIDTVIGDRSQFATGRYTASSEYVADAVMALDNGLSNLADDFVAAQGANEARFRNLDRRINKLDDKISKGIAGSNALAALKPLDSSYRSQLAVALGGFDGDQAVAFGAFHYINNRTMINAGISYSGRNYNSYNVGIVFGF